MFQTLRKYLQASMWLPIKTIATSVRLVWFLYISCYLSRLDRIEHRKVLSTGFELKKKHVYNARIIADVIYKSHVVGPPYPLLLPLQCPQRRAGLYSYSLLLLIALSGQEVVMGSQPIPVCFKVMWAWWSEYPMSYHKLTGRELMRQVSYLLT
jgi:hypothetical protein